MRHMKARLRFAVMQLTGTVQLFVYAVAITFTACTQNLWVLLAFPALGVLLAYLANLPGPSNNVLIIALWIIPVILILIVAVCEREFWEAVKINFATALRDLTGASAEQGQAIIARVVDAAGAALKQLVENQKTR